MRGEWGVGGEDGGLKQLLARFIATLFKLCSLAN